MDDSRKHTLKTLQVNRINLFVKKILTNLYFPPGEYLTVFFMVYFQDSRRAI